MVFGSPDRKPVNNIFWSATDEGEFPPDTVVVISADSDVINKIGASLFFEAARLPVFGEEPYDPKFRYNDELRVKIIQLALEMMKGGELTFDVAYDATTETGAYWEQDTADKGHWTLHLLPSAAWHTYDDIHVEKTSTVDALPYNDHDNPAEFSQWQQYFEYPEINVDQNVLYVAYPDKFEKGFTGVYIEYQQLETGELQSRQSINAENINTDDIEWTDWQTITTFDPSNVGVAGPKGDKGDKGDTGDTGPQGPQGDTGPQGEQGPPGADGSDGQPAPDIPEGDNGDETRCGAALNMSRYLCGLYAEARDQAADAIALGQSGALAAETVFNALLAASGIGIPVAVALEALSILVNAVVAHLEASQLPALTEPEKDKVTEAIYCALVVSAGAIDVSADTLSAVKSNLDSRSGSFEGFQVDTIKQAIDVYSANTWKKYAWIGSLNPSSACVAMDCNEFDWCVEYDFTASDCGFTSRFGSYGAYSSGNGWQATDWSGHDRTAVWAAKSSLPTSTPILKWAMTTNMSGVTNTSTSYGVLRDEAGDFMYGTKSQSDLLSGENTVVATGSQALSDGCVGVYFQTEPAGGTLYITKLKLWGNGTTIDSGFACP